MTNVHLQKIDVTRFFLNYTFILNYFSRFSYCNEDKKEKNKMKTGQRKGRSKVNFFYAKLGLFFFLHSCLCDRYKSAEGWRIGAENVRLVNKSKKFGNQKKKKGLSIPFKKTFVCFLDINNFRDSNSTGVNEKPCKYFQIDKSLHCKGEFL